MSENYLDQISYLHAVNNLFIKCWWINGGEGTSCDSVLALMNLRNKGRNLKNSLFDFWSDHWWPSISWLISKLWLGSWKQNDESRKRLWYLWGRSGAAVVCAELGAWWGIPDPEPDGTECHTHDTGGTPPSASSGKLLKGSRGPWHWCLALKRQNSP